MLHLTEQRGRPDDSDGAALSLQKNEVVRAPVPR